MKSNVFKQHAENEEWLGKLGFYNDEIRIMQDQLEEVSMKNTSADIRGEIEHFQNQFIIQRKNADDLRRQIKQEEKSIVHNLGVDYVAGAEQLPVDHGHEKDLMSGFESNFSNLRKEFRDFLGKRL